MTTNQNAAPVDALERVACSRCGGTGHHSYCTMHGTRCFKCRGNKMVFTRRGAAAAKFLDQLRNIPVEEIKVGDFMRAEVHTISTSTRFFVRVESIELRPSLAKRLDFATGEWVALPDLWAIVGTNTKHGQVVSHIAQGAMVRKGWTAEEKAAQLREALAYQATLTLTGAARKGQGARSKMKELG